MTGYHPRGDLVTRVEQAVAMGRTPDWIYDRLGVEPAFVDGVLARMDAANRNDPPPQFPPATPDTITELIDAICPRQNRARDQLGQYRGAA